MSQVKEPAELIREKLRQEELKGNPSSSIHGGGLVDLVGRIGWKGSGILILLIIAGFMMYTVLFR